MTNQNNQNDPLDAELDGALRKMAKEIHPRPAFVAKLRGELEHEAAHPRRDFWGLLTRSRPLLSQAVLIAALAALVLVAGSLTGRLFAPDGSEFREVSANLTPSAAQNVSDSLPVGALARLGKGKIQSIDAAPDGRIAVGSKAGLCVYNTGLTPDWCRWTDAPVHEARFDPTGTRLAVRYGSQNVVEIWDAAQGQVIASREFTISIFYTSSNLPNPNFFIVKGMAWEPSSDQQVSRLAVIDTNQGVSVWDWQNDTIAWGPVAVESAFIGTQWIIGPEGESIVSVLTPDALILFEGNTGQNMNVLSNMAGAAPGSFLTLDRASQGSRLAVGSDDKISVFDPAAWNVSVYQSIPHPAGRFYGVALSPDGEHVAALTNDAQIVTFDLRNGQETGRMRAMPLTPMAWNPADGRLYYASPDGSLASFDGTTDNIIASGHTLAPQVIAWRDDGTIVTAANNFIYTWDVSTQSLYSFGEMTLSNSVIAAGLSKDGARALFFDASNNRMIVWDVAQNQPLHDFRSSGFLHAVTFSPDGTRLAAVNEDGQILTWKLLDNGSEERDLTGISGFISVDALAFHPDGEQIAVAYTKEDGSPALEVHDIASQQKIADIPLTQNLPTTEPVSELSWSEGGQYLGAAQGLETVVWETSSWNRRTWSLPVDEASPLSLRAFSFNGTQGLASAERDVFYSIWSTEARYTFSGHAMTVTDLSFRPDGEALASASNDGTVILWGLGSASLPPVEVQPTATPLPLTMATATPKLMPTYTAITLQEYTVVEGDTCGGIAYAFNISVSSLITLNNLSPECDNLFVGQVLRIPYPTPTPQPGYPAPIDPTGTATADAYSLPGLTITPTPTRTTMPGQPTPLPDATQHPDPDTTGYDVTRTNGISPTGKWRWYLLRGEWMPGAPREEDLNVITAASTNGMQTWVLEEYTPHGLGEGRPTGFTFSADDRYMFFYDEGTPDGCGQPWQANLRRLDLQSGIVEPVPPIGHTPYGKFALSPQADRLAVVTGIEIEIYDTYSLQVIKRIALPEVGASNWSTTNLYWSPLPSTMVAFEIVSPPENSCSTPSLDQSRWTVVASVDGGTAVVFSSPPGYALLRWAADSDWGPESRLIYQSPDGSEITLNPRTGETIP